MALSSTLSSALPASLTRQELRHELQAFRGNLSNDIREICDRLRDSIRADLQRQLSEKKDSRADIWKEHLTLQDVGEAGFLASPSSPTQTRTVLVQPRKADVPRSQSLSPKAEFRKGNGPAKEFPSSASSSQLRQAGETEPTEDEEEAEASYLELLARARQRRSRFDDAENTSRWKAHRRMPKGKKKSVKAASFDAGAEVLSKARSSQYMAEKPHWALRIVENPYFDYVLIAFLLGNALTFGIEADVMARQSLLQPPAVFTALNIAFTMIFVAELTIRIVAYHWNFLFGEGWMWNLFDLIIVFFSVVDEVSQLFLSGSDVQTLLSFAGVLRMLRLGRVMRLIRLVRVVPALKSMVYLVSASMNSFFWTGVLLLLLMYCVAVYFTDLATEATRLNANTSVDLTEVRRYWGSLGQAVASLFQAITGGMDWRVFVEVFETALPESHDMLLVVFSLYIAFATLVMLNLVTGVFVEGAQRIAKEEKEQELIKSVQKLCVLADTSGDGEITWEEFEANLSSQEMITYLKTFDMDSSQARDIFYVLDTNDSGTVSLEEFIGASIKLHTPARMADREILRIYIRDCFAELNLRLQSMDDMWRKMRPKLDAIIGAS